MPWLGTFHAIGTKILRRHAELVGLKSGFTILDTDDQIRLMKQVLQANNVDDKRWPARGLSHLIDAWKNRGLDPGPGAGRRGRRLRQRQGADPLRGIPGAPQDAERGRLRRPAARGAAAVPRQPGHPRPISGPLPIHAGRRVPGTPTSSSTCGCACWRRAATTSAASATTTSRSTAGAAPRSTTSCGSSTTFPAPRWCGSRTTIARPATILGAASGLIAHNEDRLGKTLFTEGELGEKPTVAGVWDSEEEARSVGEGDRAAPTPGALASTRWRSWFVPPSRCASSRSASSPSGYPIG